MQKIASWALTSSTVQYSVMSIVRKCPCPLDIEILLDAFSIKLLVDCTCTIISRYLDV